MEMKIPTRHSKAWARSIYKR